MIGSTLSHFRVLEVLGSGGMGVVYRAQDLSLERDVAIKVLPAGALADETQRKLFRKEAVTLARLNHPNIGAIHEFDSKDGLDFLVMELVPGQTLSDRVRGGGLPEREMRRLGKQLADGLAAAHKEGVLHRDIKPGNLRLTTDGRLKILDFGLARLTRTGDVSMTKSTNVDQHIVGTLPYMPPEQLRGEPVDVRCDIYAAGAVLYEMACGTRAFPQQSAPALMGAILGQPPVPPSEIVPEIPRDIERIILRCLEKDPARRYASARELGADLRQVARPEPRGAGARQDPRGALATSKTRPRPKRSSVPFAALGLGALALVTALAFVFDLGGVRSALLGGGGSTSHSLAVLPLANLSGDPGQEFFADGMTDELITKLAQVSAMRVISRSSVMQYKGASKSLRSIAKELGVRMVVEGSVARVGGIVRVSAQLIDALEDRNVWADSYERTSSNVLLLEGELAGAIVKNVQAKLTPDERTRLGSARPVDTQAHDEYLKGLYCFNQFSIEGFKEGIEHFNKAIARDPGSAPAYGGLASCYYALSSVALPANEAMPRAKAAAQKALSLDPNLASAHVALAYVQGFYDWNWPEAERTFHKAIRLNPSETSAHLFLGQLLLIVGRPEQASTEIERARKIDPLSSYASGMSLWPLYFERRFPEALTAATHVAAVDPTNASPHFVLGLALSMTGHPDRGAQEFLRAYALDPRPNYLSYVGWAHTRMGDHAGAVAVLHRLQALSESTYVQPYNFAVAFAAAGQRDSAFAALDRGIQLRSEEMLEIKSSVAMDTLRADPRFGKVLRRMNLSS